jgi:hypothetical protein
VLKRQREGETRVVTAEHDVIIKTTIARPPVPALALVDRQNVPVKAPWRRQLAPDLFEKFMSVPIFRREQLRERVALLCQGRIT